MLVIIEISNTFVARTQSRFDQIPAEHNVLLHESVQIKLILLHFGTLDTLILIHTIDLVSLHSPDWSPRCSVAPCGSFLICLSPCNDSERSEHLLTFKSSERVLKFPKSPDESDFKIVKPRLGVGLFCWNLGYLIPVMWYST